MSLVSGPWSLVFVTRDQGPETRDCKGDSMAADDGSKIPSPFDVRTIKDLVSLMSRHDLSEIDLREGDLRIRLRRGQREAIVVPAAPVAAPVAAAVQNSPPAPANNTPAEAKPARNLHDITSPTPGTFYAAPSPEAEPFVKVGTRVTPTTVVCVIEAMKIFNEIQAECSGVIAEILAENQKSVEYGQVLFRVDPTG
jgi:acetyl-CoA carboxylase biotin carboxyl carrier protein